MDLYGFVLRTMVHYLGSMTLYFFPHISINSSQAGINIYTSNCILLWEVAYSGQARSS